MTFLGRLLGYLSIGVNLLLSLALLSLGLIAWFDGSPMRLDPIPNWTGSVTGTAILGGLAGLIAVVLAFRPGKISRAALVLWSLVVTVIFGNLFWSPLYRFNGFEDFKRSLWIFLGCLLVLFGSWLHLKNAPPRRPAYRT